MWWLVEWCKIYVWTTPAFSKKINSFFSVAPVKYFNLSTSLLWKNNSFYLVLQLRFLIFLPLFCEKTTHFFLVLQLRFMIFLPLFCEKTTHFFLELLVLQLRFLIFLPCEKTTNFFWYSSWDFLSFYLSFVKKQLLFSGAPARFSDLSSCVSDH